MLQECCESQPARPPRRAVFAAFCSGAREIFHEGVGPRFVCISSLFAAYCVRAVFACFCKYAADRTFVQLVLADLGTGAYALADTSTEAFADALAATWARVYPSADPGVIAVVLRS